MSVIKDSDEIMLYDNEVGEKMVKILRERADM